MAEPDPNTPQVVDPERVVDLTRLLQIRGPLGVLNVLDTIVPVVNMGDVVARSVEVRQPAFRSTDIFSAGVLQAPPVGTVLADTGALAEGIYDIRLIMTTNSAGTFTDTIQVQHRNAANTANLAAWDFVVVIATSDNAQYRQQEFAYELGLNERLRIINVKVGQAAKIFACTIFARRRA